MVDHLQSDERTDTDILLTRVANGNREAENQLLARNRPRLKRMIQTRIDPRLSKRVDASDVVQEALAEASRSLPTYLTSRPVAFYPWLRQIALNKLIDIHRKHLLTTKRSVDREASFTLDHSRSGSLIFWLKSVMSPLPSPSEAVIQQEQLAQLEQALETLSEDEQELLLLRHVEKLSVAEVAEILGISAGAVKSRHFRTIEKLRLILGQ